MNQLGTGVARYPLHGGYFRSTPRPMQQPNDEEVPLLNSRQLALLVLLVSTGLAITWLVNRVQPVKETASHSSPQVQAPPAELTEHSPSATPTPPTSRARITGVVRDLHTNKSLGGAEVALTSVRSFSFVTHATATTDPAGRFALLADDPLLLTSGDLMLQVSAEGYVPYQHTHAVTPIHGENLDVGALRLRPGFRVEGTVLLPSGVAARVGAVHLIDTLETARRGRLDGTRVQGAALIQEDGSFVTFVNGPRFALQATVPNYAPSFSEVLSVDSSQRVEIHVRPESVLQGRVLDTAGNPIMNAKVTAGAFMSKQSPDHRFGYYLGHWSAETASRGEFTIAGLPEGGRLTVLCSHAEYREARVLDASTDQELEIRMLEGRVLRARFVTQDEHEVFPKSIRIRTPEGETVSLRRQSGTYTSEPFRSDSSAGQLSAEGYLSQLLSWPEGPGLHDLGVVNLETGLFFQVHLLDSKGQPVRGHVRVAPTDSSRTPFNLFFAMSQGVLHSTNVNGELTLGGLLDLPYAISASAPGYTSRKAYGIPTLEGTDLAIALSQSGTWSVRIVDENNAPIGDAEVELQSAEVEFSAVSRAGEDGLVRFVDVPMQVDLTASARAPGFRSRSFLVDALTQSPEQAADHALLPGASVEIRVADERGSPVSGAIVQLEPAGSPEIEISETSIESLTDRDGQTVIRGLAAGPYQLTVSAPGYADAENSVHIASTGARTNIYLANEEQATIVGRVFYDDGSAVPNASVSLEPGEHPWGFRNRVSTDASRDGSYTLSIPEPFEGQVSLSVSWGTAQETILSANSLNELPREIVVPRGGDLRFFLVDETGAPFSGEAELSVSAVEHDFEASWRYRPTSGSLHVEFEDLPAGVLRLDVQAAGYRAQNTPLDISIEPDTRREVVLTLAPERSPEPFFVIVVDELGRPIPAAIVEVTTAKDDLLGGITGSLLDSIWCQTNSEGLAEWLGFSNAKYEISVVKRGFQEFERELIPTPELTVTLLASASLRVEVTDERGRSEPDVKIRVQQISGTEESGALDGLVGSFVDGWLASLLPKELLESDSSSEHFSGLDPGQHRLSVITRECFEHIEVVELSPKQSVDLEVVVPTAFQISGRASQTNRPLANVQIEVVSLDQLHPGNATLRTNENGNFSASFRRPGEYSFRILGPAEGPPALSVRIQPNGFVTLDFE